MDKKADKEFMIMALSLMIILLGIGIVAAVST